MMELAADLTLGLYPFRPVHDGAVARATEMRSHLLGPLVRSIHRMCPAHCIVVVGLDAAEFIDPRRKEFGRLEMWKTGERS